MTTIGILGGGQLGRMLILAGAPLGLRFRVFEPAPDSPAGELAPQTGADYADEAALIQFASAVDVITYEFENVPLPAAALLAQHAPVYPPPLALETAQDRLTEKRFFAGLGAALPPFAPIDSRADLDAALAQFGDAVLKTRRLGYDGKGQAVIRSAADADAAWDLLGGQPLILEQFVAFDRELSLLACRDRFGATVCYPLVQNSHRAGILRVSRAPAPQVSAALQAQAEQLARAALDALGYVGVLAIELFQRGDTLLVNEMAPRVHNSGHWTIEGAVTSQFANQIRAVAGLPLGSPAPRGHSAMVNIIGEPPDPAAALGIPGAGLHLYGKQPRAGRKLGHITLCTETPDALDALVAQVQQLPGCG